MTRLQLSNANPNFIPPEPQDTGNRVPKILEQRLEKTKELYRKSYLSYNLDSQNETKQDSREILNQELVKNYPKECVAYDLISIVRVQLPNDRRTPMFVNNKNEYDGDTKSAIIAKVQVSILDETSVKLGSPQVAGSQDENNFGQYSVQYTIGRVLAPQVKLSYNRDLTKVTNSELVGLRPVYTLPDNKQTIQMLIDIFGPVLKGFRVGIAAKNGEHLTEVHKVPNESEFINGDISDLIAADGKRLLGEREGGLASYLNYKKIEDQLISEGFSEQKLSKLQKDDIIEMLKQKDKNAKKQTIKRSSKKQ